VGIGTSASFKLSSFNRMQVYLESAIIMDYLEFLEKIGLININEAFLEDDGVLHVNFE
jgi:hypothetical protein